MGLTSFGRSPKRYRSTSRRASATVPARGWRLGQYSHSPSGGLAPGPLSSTSRTVHRPSSGPHGKHRPQAARGREQRPAARHPDARPTAAALLAGERTLARGRLWPGPWAPTHDRRYQMASRTSRAGVAASARPRRAPVQRSCQGTLNFGDTGERSGDAGGLVRFRVHELRRPVGMGSARGLHGACTGSAWKLHGLSLGATGVLGVIMPSPRGGNCILDTP